MTKVEELEQEILEEEKRGLSSKLKELYRKRDLLIEKDIDKDIYHKKLSNDSIINVAGESGSGKSTLCEVFKDKEEFLVIDTDLLDSYEELVKYFGGVFPEIFDEAIFTFYLGALINLMNAPKKKNTFLPDLDHLTEYVEDNDSYDYIRDNLNSLGLLRDLGGVYQKDDGEWKGMGFGPTIHRLNDISRELLRIKESQ